MYNALYQIKSEALYGIPGKYFHDSVDNRLMYLGCIVILMGMCAIPVIIKKHDEKSLGQKKVSYYEACIQKEQLVWKYC